MRRSTMIAALLLAAMVFGGDAQPVSCPYGPTPIWNLQPAIPAVIPVGANCSTASIYTVFQYWTPELSGSTLGSGTGNNPAPASVSFTPTPRDAAGNALQAPGVSCQWFASYFGDYPGPTTVPPTQITTNAAIARSCGNLAAPNSVGLPAGAVLVAGGNTTANSPADCCRLCTNTILCKQFAYMNNATAANVTCLLFSTAGTVNATGTLTAFVGFSAGWGSSFVSCTGANIGDIRTVQLTPNSGIPFAYTQLCSNGSTPGVRPADTPLTIPVAAPADAPVATVSNLTVSSVCSSAAAVTGTFFYSGTNVAGQTSFRVTLNGATCTPGAANIAGITAGTFVPYTCTVAGGIPAGALNVTTTATYSGSQTTGGCAGNKTVSTSGSGTSTTAPTAALAVASTPATVCTGNTQIIANFLYNSSAASTVFSTLTSPTSVCSVSPTTPPSGATPVTVTCTRTGGFPAGNATVTLTATYTGSPPCTASNSTSASSTVAVVNAESGVSVTPVTAPDKCAPTKAVGATFRFNATNVGTITFAATSAGLSCSTDQTTVSGSTGSVSYVVSATCNSIADIPAGTVPITLTATYQGQGPCANGTASGIASVKIDPTPSVTVAPVGTPVPDCFGAQSVVEDFRVTVANGATNTALTAQLAGLYNCTVTPAVVPANGVVSVSCTKPDGFPSGRHNLTIQATAAGPAGACAGTYTSSSYTTITVLPAPVLAITPVTADEPICAGDQSVSVTWRYDVTGTVGTPTTTATSVVADNGVTCVLGAPVGTPARGTVTAVCTNLPTTNAEVDITLTMTVTEPGCGTVTADATTTYSVACCLYNTTAYAKVADNNPNEPFCYRHQRPNNFATRSCPFYYGWFNQGPTTSDVSNVDSASHLVALTDPSSPGCAFTTEVASVTALCEGVLPSPNSQGTNVLKITVSGYKYSNVKTFVYSGCPNRRDAIPLTNSTCTASNPWKPWNWNRYEPTTITDVPAGRGAALQFRIPIARTGSCTCNNVYWTVVQEGTFKGVPCPAAP